MPHKTHPTVQRTYRLEPALARRIRQAADKLGITQNELIAGAAAHALDQRRPTPKAKARQHATT